MTAIGATSSLISPSLGIVDSAFDVSTHPTSPQEDLSDITILKRAYLPDERMLYFAQKMIDGHLEIFFVQKPFQEDSDTENKKYVRYPGPACEALWKMAPDFYDQFYFHYDSPIKFILQNPNNHLLTVHEFLTFLTTPNESGTLPIFTINMQGLKDVLDLAKETHFTIDFHPDPVTGETLFSKCACSGNIAITQRVFTEMQEQEIALSFEDTWLQKAFLNDCSFTQGELLAFPKTLQDRIYQVASSYSHKELLLKLHDCGIHTPPTIDPEECSIFHNSMDLIDVENTLCGFFRSLRSQHLLLTEEEFNIRRDPSKRYYCKNRGEAIARIFGRDYIEKTAQRLHLTSIKVPKKTAIIKPEEPGRFSCIVKKNKGLESDDLLILAEGITPTTRKATKQELLQLLDIIEATGYNDTTGLNFLIGTNYDGEEGIYCIDTEYTNFSNPHYETMARDLRYLVNNEDWDWFKEEVERRHALFNASKADREHDYQEKSELSEPLQIKHGWSSMKPWLFTFPVEALIS